MHWLYLHGFLSSPNSAKAVMLQRWLEAMHDDVDFSAPCLPLDPRAAMDTLRHTLASAASDSKPVTGLIGSSLGGFYARVLCADSNLPAVLINPALRPDRLLADYLGQQINPYTGELHEFGTDDLEYLRRLVVAKDPMPQRLFLLVQMNDETLDSAQSVSQLRASPAWIQPGGSHRFDEFERTFPAIRTFLSASTC